MLLLQVSVDRRIWSVCVPDPVQPQQARPLRHRRQTEVRQLNAFTLSTQHRAISKLATSPEHSVLHKAAALL